MTLLTTYPPTITFSSIIVNIIFWGIVIALYKNRNKSPQNKKMWNTVQIFLAVLLATLGANYIKKSVKDWLSK